MSESRATPSATRRSRRVLPTLIGLGTIALLAWYWRDSIHETFSRVRPVWFALAFVAGLALSVLQGLLFGQLMRKNGGTSSSREMVAAFLVSQPGKYIPGKIWAPVFQHFSLGGTTSVAVTAAANIELAGIMLIQVTALGIACLQASRPWIAILVALLATVVAAGVLRWRLVPALAGRFPRLAVRLGIVETSGVPSQVRLSRALVLAGAATCAALLASWLVLVAAGPIIAPSERMPALGTLFLGFASSVLVVPVPAGLGVREAATIGFGALLTPALSAGQLVSLAIFFRCWQLLVDVGCVALGWLVSRHGPGRG